MTRPDAPALSLLAIGDVHLGTRPSGLPDALFDDAGIDRRDLTPQRALEDAIRLAINRGVDAVLFAGDVVESSNARFEALRPLERAVEELVHHGIACLAVAGNHDVEALPRLAARIEGLELLGGGGQWQSRMLEKNGRAQAEIFGWSFPSRDVRTSPLADLADFLAECPKHDVPRIGLLHGDLGASGGPYAPVQQGELDRTLFAAWLLGHIHIPSLNPAARQQGVPHSGYLGSLIGLDRSETGDHGPWLIEVSANGELCIEQIPNERLRWEIWPVSVEGIESADDVENEIYKAIDACTRAIQGQGVDPLALGIRLKLTGRTSIYQEIRDKIKADWLRIAKRIQSTEVFVSAIDDRLELAVDLESIAKGNDPPALLAQKLLALARGGSEATTLIREARKQLRGQANHHRWSDLEDHRSAIDPLSDASLMRWLSESGTACFYDLLEQKRAHGGSGEG